MVKPAPGEKEGERMRLINWVKSWWYGPDFEFDFSDLMLDADFYR